MCVCVCVCGVCLFERCDLQGAELAEMALFFEKHRLTRERLEGSAALLLEKLKTLQKKAPTAASNGIDPTEWEEYDVKNPLFPFLAVSQEAYNLYLPKSIDVLKVWSVFSLSFDVVCELE
jgi:hypothetical protein